MRKLIDFATDIATFALSNWTLVVSVITGAAAMGLAARATEWLQAWGQIAWVSAVLIGCIMGAAFFALVQIGRSRISLGRAYRALAARPTGTNPMKGAFSREHIILNDFFTPVQRPYRNVVFEDCRIVGPSLICLTGNVHMEGNHF
jgi:hypothetical protein